MLVRLYAPPDSSAYDARTAEAGIAVRRMEAWDRAPLQRFILKHFGEAWASEADLAFANGHPTTGFVAMKDGAIADFAVYECVRRGYFGPTGMREDLCGHGAGTSLLFRASRACGSWDTHTPSSAASGRRSSTRRSAARPSSKTAIPGCTGRCMASKPHAAQRES
ncbi:MAG: hypothetical protein WEB52_00960 [Dehalococcoidia bacterium]